MIRPTLRYSGRSNSSSGLYAQRRLARLDFHSFQRCVWLWLGACGYEHMRFCGRRSQRGRTGSGPDFTVRIGGDGLEVAVQVRHWKSPVSKRAVDELRGVLLRDNISAGMIVASSTSSAAARLAAANYPGRPIRIIGVDRLCESLQSLGIDLDDKFFGMIRHFTLGSPRAERVARRARIIAAWPEDVDFQRPEPHGWLVVIALAIIFMLLLMGLGR